MVTSIETASSSKQHNIANIVPQSIKQGTMIVVINSSTNNPKLVPAMRSKIDSNIIPMINVANMMNTEPKHVVKNIFHSLKISKINDVKFSIFSKSAEVE